MKIIVLAATLILVLSTFSTAFPTTDDVKWLNSTASNDEIIKSGMELAASATSSLDVIQANTYIECLKSNVSRALDESEKYTVSNELQKTKNYYELALNEFYSGAIDYLDGIKMNDASKLERGDIHLMEGKRYITLSTNELNQVMNPSTVIASPTFDSVIAGPYKISFDLGISHDAYNVTVDDPKSTEKLNGDKITTYKINIKNSTPFTFDLVDITLEHQDAALYSQTLSSVRQSEVIYKQALESEYNRVETATREIDGTWGIVANVENYYYCIIYYPPADNHLKIVVSSTYPWDEGTLQLLKTIHVEKSNSTS
jgi:hypothetical protein